MCRGATSRYQFDSDGSVRDMALKDLNKSSVTLHDLAVCPGGENDDYGCKGDHDKEKIGSEEPGIENKKEEDMTEGNDTKGMLVAGKVEVECVLE
ncbi:hypothetical protein ACH5RR_039533 [Cinchona calisaya]|uniref:Uncharacterized protein n=1 Tax=Cinchona calisaya TaxID=153742 RepID=A0ABD2Y3Q6_9GENT